MRTDGNIHVAAQRTFFHIAVADVEVTHQPAHFGEKLSGFFSRTQHRIGHYLDQGRTGAVVIQPGNGFVTPSWMDLPASSSKVDVMNLNNPFDRLPGLGVFNPHRIWPPTQMGPLSCESW